jgi:hypothetical protein
MFHKESDLEAFERVMVEARLRQPSRILLYCVLAIAMAGGTADELDGSCRRSFDHEGRMSELRKSLSRPSRTAWRHSAAGPVRRAAAGSRMTQSKTARVTRVGSAGRAYPARPLRGLPRRSPPVRHRSSRSLQPGGGTERGPVPPSHFLDVSLDEQMDVVG